MERTPFKPWVLPDGKQYGTFKVVENLAFLKVKDDGHMVPKDQPYAA